MDGSAGTRAGPGDIQVAVVVEEVALFFPYQPSGALGGRTVDEAEKTIARFDVDLSGVFVGGRSACGKAVQSKDYHTVEVTRVSIVEPGETELDHCSFTGFVHRS